MFLEIWMIIIVWIIFGMFAIWMFRRGYLQCYSLIEVNCQAILKDKAESLIQQGYVIGFKECQELYRLEAVRLLTEQGQEIPELLKHKIT
jgi:hypothetical protein